jgi:lysophospholipid acyltransferase (LPLAT)-like uncharacterized protein
MKSKAIKSWLLRAVAPRLAAALIRLLANTLKVRVEDPSGFLQKLPSQPFLIAFWHNRILLMTWFCQRLLSQRRVVTMISRSGDGQLITDTIAQFGLQAVRGSTSKKGMVAFRAALRLAQEQGCDIAFTPDGPRGPRYQVQPGILHLSVLTGCPIIPVSFHLERKWELRSWDRFQIPQPFTTCTLQIGEPMRVEEGTDLAVAKERLAAALKDRLPQGRFHSSVDS